MSSAICPTHITVIIGVFFSDLKSCFKAEILSLNMLKNGLFLRKKKKIKN